MANKIPIVVADFETQLSTSISASDTTFSISSNVDDDGNTIPSGKYCFTVENGSTNKEYLIGQLNGTDVTSVYSVTRQGSESSGAARAHRIGASVIITDFATIQRVEKILRGQETLDASNPLSYDAEPSLSANEEIATVGYVLSVVTGGSVTFDKQVITGVNAGETVSAGELLYLKTSDQEWYKVDADTANNVDDVEVGIALGSGTDGVAISGGVQLSGVYTTTGLTAGSTYYASNTAGGLSTSAGTTPCAVGIALSTTKLLLTKVLRTPTGNQKAALAGTSGTPSSSNKYVTNADTTGSGSVLRADAVTDWVQELFIPVTARYDNGSGTLVHPYDAQTVNFPIAVIDSSENVYFSFKVPSDFTSLTEASVIIIPDASETIQFDINTSYSASTQTYNTHTGSASNQTQAVTVSIMTKVDINLGTCFSSLAANDFLTINFQSDTSSLQVVGLLFKYS